MTRRAATAASSSRQRPTLTSKPRGSGGFGYDPVFVPAGWDVTMAELSAEEKDRISHRGRAFRAMRARLEENGA